jgi:hypothetical protein
MPGTARQWRVGQLADFELANRRSELERAIAAGEPDMAVLQAKLAEIAGEQEARATGLLARQGLDQ